MGSNPAAGLTCRPKGASAPERLPGSERRRYQSESDIGPISKSLSRLCSRDEDERAAALEELSQGVLTRLGLDRPGSAQLGEETLLQLLRLSRSCPLQEVRERAAELLQTAQVRRGFHSDTSASKTTQTWYTMTVASVIRSKYVVRGQITTSVVGLHQPMRTF